MTESASRLGASPLLGAICAQALGTVLAALLFYFCIPEVLYQPLLAAAIQGACAAIASNRLRQPSWWQGIHLAFVPCVLIAYRLQWSPWVWLAGFTLLLLIFWRTDKSRVPLYLSNRSTADVLLGLLPAGPRFILDAGCGDGGLLRRLALARPDCEFVGIEHAPLTWLWARLLSGHLNNLHIRLGDLWQQPLAPFDVVYAFLSPAPMPALWQKARTEMRPSTLLVSNSFAVPQIDPEAIQAVGDGRATQLYCYRITESDENSTSQPRSG